jgi:NAD(P)-dependent dehydrogenase (short-subunit alcohol dehydrogenase family)
VLLDHAPSRLPKVFPELADSPGHLLIGSVDATGESVAGALQQAVDRFGRIDVLVNAVGGWQGGQPVHETSLETWDSLVTLNARSAFALSRAVVPHMLARGAGRIVHVAARAGLEGTARSAAYSASKSAVVRLTESLAAELKNEGITANCVLPGTIDTPQNRTAMPRADHSRWVPPEAIAGVILFLASDAAWPVSGAAVPVYGRS